MRKIKKRSISNRSKKVKKDRRRKMSDEEKELVLEKLHALGYM
ncbi:MAG: hypothetical protein ABSD68_01545 [Candidatus Micrarchaeales archaeon]|jgi:hypothetical protein